MSRNTLRTVRALAAGATLMGLTACATAAPPNRASGLAEAAGGPFLGAPRAAGGATADLWWRLFDDPALDRHVARAFAANTDLRVAVANLEAARAVARQGDAARLPATVIESGAGSDRADRQPSTSSVPKTSYELGVTLAYEVDLFGRVRAAAEAGAADAEAAQATRDAVRVAVAADTTLAYLDLCGAQARARLAEALTASQRRSRELVAEQVRAGEASPLDLARATVLWDQAAAALPNIEAERRRALFRLAVLEGRLPSEAAEQPACLTMPRVATAFPVGDGAGLLARRPDIRAAERRLAAATARVRVARADLYPRIQLGASGGLIGGGSDAILTPLITWAFPNRAAIAGRIGAAQGSADAALATWDGVVLQALQEVETALADVAMEAERGTALNNAATEADLVVRRAQARHRLGADSYLVVIDAERTRNAAATELLASRLRLAQAYVALFRALGGGWQSGATTQAAGDGAPSARVDGQHEDSDRRG